jgi:ribosome-binding factor A
MITKVKHSESKNAWNVIGVKLGGKYKIARVPYTEIKDDQLSTMREIEKARKDAEFISFCFNNKQKILDNL